MQGGRLLYPSCILNILFLLIADFTRLDVTRHALTYYRTFKILFICTLCRRYKMYNHPLQRAYGGTTSKYIPHRDARTYT